MKSLWFVSSLLCSAPVVIGCTKNAAGGDTQATAVTSSSGNDSGEATSAPEASTRATDEPTGSPPTMATTTTTTATTTTTTATTTTIATADGVSGMCDSLNCEESEGVMNECDNFAQDCPAGQKCVAYSSNGAGGWDALKCVGVTGMDKPGDTCTSKGDGVDSCIKGAICWGVSREGMGTCVALCTGSWEAPVCENTAFCTISGLGLINLCLPLSIPS